MAAFRNFTDTVWEHYREHKRPMPWRDNTSLYYVVVSEIMLQQTQVSRVLKKFPAFIKRFPDWKSLASASKKELLEEWSGLGYNRRALYLQRIAEHFTQVKWPKSSVSDMYRELRSVPGIGPNTAGSIIAFASNAPVAFIETNIRTVFIHHFFRDTKKKINDGEIMPLVEEALADPYVNSHAREWYWALMDYGSHLKSVMPNPSRRSTHHVKQKPFKGSNRELRSKILRTIMKKPMTGSDVHKTCVEYTKADVERNIGDLLREGFITEKNCVYQIAS